MSDLTNPFPGLRPFDEREGHLFFGRESQVDTMIDKLGASRFLAVVGPSGSGKSSLVNCGLRPALHRGALAQAGTSWRIARFRPGSDPLQSMTQALAAKGLLFENFPNTVSIEEVIDTHLRMSKRGLIELFRKARLPKHTNLLIIADQFEELFRYGRLGASDEERAHKEAARALVNLLLEPHAELSQRIYVVLTMRSDFLGDCAAFEGLPEAINRGQYLVPRMTRDERRAAIEGPIHVAGATIKPVLLTRLVNDVGDNPDQLSILQHALNRTWAKWSEAADGPISLEDYEGTGTMARALDTHANDAYAELKGEAQRQLASRIFKALTDKGSDVRGIRRPTRFGQLCAIVDGAPDALKSVIEVFRHPSRSFLMPPAPDAINDDTVIDISHESLMRVWKRLDEWSSQEAADAEQYRRLAQSAALHSQGKIDLMGGAELMETREWWDSVQPNEEWAHRYHEGYAAAKEFLVGSETNDRRWRRKKRLRKRLSIAGTLAVIALSAVIVMIYREAEAQKQQEAQKLEKARADADKTQEKRKKLADAVQKLSVARLNEFGARQFARFNPSDRAKQPLELSTVKTSAAVAFAAVVAAEGTPIPIDSMSTDDLFDFSSGSRITGSSGFGDYLGPNKYRMFGTTSEKQPPPIKALSEHSVALFKDQEGWEPGKQGLFWVEWKLPAKHIVKSVSLFAIHDSISPDSQHYKQRVFYNFKLHVKAPSGQWREVTNYSPAIPYGGNAPRESERGQSTALSVCFDVHADGQFFRAEFTSDTKFAPRIVELDGNENECPDQYGVETWLEHAQDSLDLQHERSEEANIKAEEARKNLEVNFPSFFLGKK